MYYSIRGIKCPASRKRLNLLNITITDSTASIVQLKSKTNNNSALKKDNNIPLNNDDFYKKDKQVSSNLLKAYYVKNITFKGTPYELPKRCINNAYDAIKQWELLRFAKYSDATTDCLYPESKKIRLQNYSFLDKLTSNKDKEIFVKEFKTVTGFPNLEETSQKILNEFTRATHKIANTFNEIFTDTKPAQIVASGYDYTSSVAQKLALPGSDLNNSYVILKGFDDPVKDAALCREFKSNLWDEVDQRLLGINRENTMPMVYTQAQVHKNLTEFSAIMDIGDNLDYCKYLRLTAVDPIQGAEYNMRLAENLKDQKTAERVKDFAYLIEAVRDGAKTEFDYNGFGEICDKMNKSQFSWCSNVSQLKALDNKVNYEGIRREKLDYRESLKSKFDSFKIEDQYDIVKNIIKGASRDHDEDASIILGKPSPMHIRPKTKHEELMEEVVMGNNDIDNRRKKLDAILTGQLKYYYDGKQEYFTI